MAALSQPPLAAVAPALPSVPASSAPVTPHDASGSASYAPVLLRTGIFGSLCAAVYIGGRYRAYRRRWLVAQRTAELSGKVQQGEQQGGDSGQASGEVETEAEATTGETPFSAAASLPESRSAYGSLVAFEESLLRKGSAELSILSGFVRQSLKALSNSSSGSEESEASSGDSGSSPSSSGSSPSSNGSSFSRRRFDSANSGGDRGSGELQSHCSGMSTDVTKLPDTWNVVEFHELDLAKPIGEGSFGQVFVAKYCQTTVAVKMLNQVRELNATTSMTERNTLRHLSKEAGIMINLRHPNITQYLGVCMDPPCLLMEYCAKRSVDAILKAALQDPKVGRQLSWARLLSMAFDAAKGMLYLHSRHPPIMHRDLKSANLLVDAHWRVKVADFNLSRAMEVNTTTSTVCITNPRWLAPEVLKGGQAQLASDVWSFGHVMWELMTWQLPFEKLNPFQIIVAVTQDKRGSGLPIPPQHELPAGPLPCYAQYVELMQACWARDPAARPSMDQVVCALLPLVASEMRRANSGLVSAASSALPTTPGASQAPSLTPQGSQAVQETLAPTTLDAPATTPASAFAAAAASASGNSGARGGCGEMAPQGSQGPQHQLRNATQELLDAGHVTVANACLSQMNSGCRGYPFVNPAGFFTMVRGELNE